MMRGINKDVDCILPLIPKGSTGAELGVWQGATSEKLLTRAGMLYMVDSWSLGPYRGPRFAEYLAKYGDGRTEAQIQAEYDQVYRDVCSRFIDHPVVIYRSTTRSFLLHAACANFQLDWVYIDASHEYEDVLADLEGSAKIAPMIFGDDYGNKPGVTAAVDEFARVWGLVLNRHGKQHYSLCVR